MKENKKKFVFIFQIEGWKNLSGVLHRDCGWLLRRNSLLSEVWSPAVCSSAQKSSDFNYKNLPYHSKEWRVMNIKKKLHRLGRLNPTDSFYEDNLPSEPHSKQTIGAILKNI